MRIRMPRHRRTARALGGVLLGAFGMTGCGAGTDARPAAGASAVAAPGSSPFLCTFHAGMKGTVTVS